MSEVFPPHIRAWQKSSDVVPDPLFHGPAPHFNFNDPYEQDEDRLRKATRYWAARDLERSQRAHQYDELLKAELEATERDMAGPSGKGKGTPKTPRRTPRKAAIVPPSDSKEEKEDGDEAPQSCVECLRKRIPCEPQPGKKRSCKACHKRKIHCDFLDKTAWVVLEGSKKMAESVRELAGMEKRREYFRLELKWYELQRYSFDLQRTG
ncbi:hypothetical protein M422DRAFT_270401, partial [Sphaerobolus stellatus SS14]